MHQLRDSAAPGPAGVRHSPPRPHRINPFAPVEGELEQLAETEFKGRADLEPAIGNAEILFERFGLTPTDLADLGLQPERWS